MEKTVDITQVVVAGIGFAGLIITGFLIPYLKSKSKYWKEQSEGEQVFNVRSWVRFAVEAAEMMYTGPGRGAEKLDYVMDYITRLLISKGITMDQQQVRIMIESAVHDLKKSLE